MSLATSCPACGTVFRVVEDQLQTSEGWVRCGQCAEVFNALESLFDLERASTAPPQHRPAPPPAPDRSPDEDDIGPPPSAVPAMATAPAPLAPSWPPPESVWPTLPEATPSVPPDAWAMTTSTDVLSDSRFMPLSDAYRPPESPRSPTYGGPDDRTDAAALSSAQSMPPMPAAAPAPAPPDEPVRPMAPVNTQTDADNADKTDKADNASADLLPPLPGFVVRAQRQARWQRPTVRALLGMAAVALLLSLVGQIGWHERHLVAARWPVTAPALAALCRWSGGQLEAPRLLEALWVDNTTLTRPPGVEAYRLQVTLVNRMRFDVTAPHLELTMTDPVGALVARRVLGPADFRQPAVLPSGEQVWQLDFSSADRRFAGYTVTAFYP
jgi:predicted Zn finger-like uncharacterized protein